MEDKIKKIVEKLVKKGINMNVFIKVCGMSIKEKIEEVTRIYHTEIHESKYKTKILKY